MNWMKFRWLYFLISGIAILLSLYAISVWHFKLSIDFTGGTLVEYHLEKPVDANANPQYRFGSDFTGEKEQQFRADLSQKTGGKAELNRMETVGPVLSQEILKKTYAAVGLSAIGILLLIAWQFKDARLGVMAVVAVLHDLVILFGIFAYLGHYHGVELDILFITAVLTIFSLSLYDTIVVYDRIRESYKKSGSLSVTERANRAISETIVRSINTSATTSFVLFALFLMGGATIKWFALALLVGVVSGTYSSPFVAVPLLVTWDEFKRKFGR